MDDSEENMSSDGCRNSRGSLSVKIKPKKRSLVERELETSLTSIITSPLNNEGSNTSRYGRARRLKTDSDFCDTDKAIANLKSPKFEKTPIKSPSAYKMHAVNSPVHNETPSNDKIDNQIENIYNVNVSLSRFGSDEKKKNLQSPTMKFPKVYVRKDLIQTKEKEKEETIILIKNMFSPVKSTKKSNSHINNILERSSGKYNIKHTASTAKQNGHLDTLSVVKTLDFDGVKNKKRKENCENKIVLSKNEIFELEVKCEYQVGDLAWARMGTFPFWPCIVTREPGSEMFVKKKLFGRIERNVIHVTFSGDNGRRSWVVPNLMRPFLGLAEFETTRDQFAPEAKKKDPRLYAAFFISEKKQSLWNASVQEAETLLREPKRLRVDIFYDMLARSRVAKITPKSQKSGKIARTDSDVSLSESLFDSLFSEEDGKGDDPDKSRTKRKSLDVSEVVTACLDNMAAKTGIPKIHKQSHMDRWLQKAKSKTPEKSHIKVVTIDKTEDIKEVINKKDSETKKDSRKKNKISTKENSVQKPYKFRKYVNESQNESDSCDISLMETDMDQSDASTSKICVIAHVESLCDQASENENNTESKIGNENSDSAIIDNEIHTENVIEAIDKHIDTFAENKHLTESVIDESKNDSDLNDTDNKVFRLNSNSNIEESKRPKVKRRSLKLNRSNNCDLEVSMDLDFEKEKYKKDTVKHTENKTKSDVLNESAEVIDTNESNTQKSNLMNGNYDDVLDNISILLNECSDKPVISKTDGKTKQLCKELVVALDDISIYKANVDQVAIENESIQKIESRKSESGDEPLRRSKRKEKKDDETVILNVVSDKIDVRNKEDCKEIDKSLDTSLEKSTNTNIHKFDLEISISVENNALETIEAYREKSVSDLPTVRRSKRKEKKNNMSGLLNKDPEKSNSLDAKDESDLNDEQIDIPIEMDKDISTNASVLNHSITVDNEISQKNETHNEKFHHVAQVRRSKRKENKDNYGTKEDPIFLKYLELKQDSIMDEHQDLTYEEIVSYLHKTWLYEVDLKTETKDNEKIEHSKREDSAKTKNVSISTYFQLNSKNNDAIDTCVERDISRNQDDFNLDSQKNNVEKCSDEKKYSDIETNKEQSQSHDTVEDDIPNAEMPMNVQEVSSKDSNETNMVEHDIPNVEMPINVQEVSSKDSTESYSLFNEPNNEFISKENQTSAANNEFKLASRIEPSINILSCNENTISNVNSDDHNKEKNSVLNSNDNNKNKEINVLEHENIVPEFEEPIELLDDELDDIETASINSAISEISITENEMLAFKKGAPAIIVNGFEGNDYIQKIKQELLDSDVAHIIKKEKLDSDITQKSKDEVLDSYAPHTIKDEVLDSYPPHTIKDEVLDSDVASMSSEGDNIALSELRLRSQAKRKNQESKLAAKETNLDGGVNKSNKLGNTGINDMQKVGRVVLKRLEDNPNVSPTVQRKLRPRTWNSPTGIKKNGFCDSQPSSPEVKCKDYDPETVSINSEDSNASSVKHRIRREKLASEDRTKDPDFLRYLEIKQDVLMDEHPELSQEEIVAYLYKTWLYEEELKPEIAKNNEETDESNAIKGTSEDTNQIKKLRRKVKDKHKLIDINKVLHNESKKNDVSNSKKSDESNTIKVNPRRKTSQPLYNEDYFDIEEEIELFEIFRKKPKNEPNSTNVDKTEQTKTDATKPDIIVKKEPGFEIKTESISKADTKEVESDNKRNQIINCDDFYDEEEMYFEQLTQPKPNIFKGLVREKVCEICCQTANLVKCNRCRGMFHVDCIKKELEVVEVIPLVRGRKKRKRGRGKAKVSTDSNGLDSESQSDEKWQDLNVSDEQNMSIDEPESHIVVADAENFEAQLEAKMKELLQTNDKVQYDSYSSDDGLNWSDTEAGKCKIVDVKLKEKLVDRTDYTDFKCNNCKKHDTPVCFVCKSDVSPKTSTVVRQRCHIAHCHKYYHIECLDHWPQTQFNTGEVSKKSNTANEIFEAMTCPRHVCHTCVCDDPRGCKTRFSGDKLARCIKCPATYHNFTKCLPAGTQILTASHIICPRHYEHRRGKIPCHVNTGWCFICAQGGSLICCEYCPTSFHAECLNIKPPEGGYMCEDCETGRLPLYSEMVWVKLGHYRWWPGIILHPSEIPDNIMAVQHSLGDFVVRFFGQYDHYWVNRGRVFPFQEGDSGRISGAKSKINEAFTKAIEHAHRAFEILKNVEENEEESNDIASSLLPPHYVKLKVNKPCGSLCGKKVDIEESSLTQCECNPNDEEPCGPYSHCLNRMLLTECGPICKAGELCQNRAFEKRQYPKMTAYRTPHRGWGLKTLEDIKAGQFVIEYVGELIDEAEFQRRMARKHEMRDENYYFLTLDKERMIDAGPKGNLARFMNHCCEPNCETQKWTVLGDVRVGLFAIHDIPANTEVTFNYNLECAGIEKKRCLCGAKRCSGYMGAKPKQEESQPKKPKLGAKRPYKKRKNAEESPSTSKNVKPKRPVGRPAKPRELTEIEKDLLIIKNATNGLSSDSECSGRLGSVDVDGDKKDQNALKRKRVSFSTEEKTPSASATKKIKLESEKNTSEVGD